MKKTFAISDKIRHNQTTNWRRLARRKADVEHGIACFEWPGEQHNLAEQHKNGSGDH